MPIVECPTCRRRLSVRDSPAVANVRCPGCKTVFRAPAPAPAATPSRPSGRRVTPRPAAPVEENPFDFGGPASSAGPSTAQDFNFDETDAGAAARLVLRRRIDTAAALLKYLAGTEVLLAVVAVLLGVVIVAMQSSGVAILALIGGLLCSCMSLAVPVTFLLIGAHNLRSKNSYGLALTGGVFAALSAAGLGLTSLAPVALGRAGVAFTPPILGVAGLAVAAAIQTLSVLSQPDVREAFRRRHERPTP